MPGRVVDVGHPTAAYRRMDPVVVIEEHQVGDRARGQTPAPGLADDAGWNRGRGGQSLVPVTAGELGEIGGGLIHAHRAAGQDPRRQSARSLPSKTVGVPEIR